MSLLLLLWYDDRLVPFMGLLMGPPDRNSVPAFGIPALLAALFGFLRSKPREIWAYGLLMWAPQAIIFGGAFAFFSDGWGSGLALVTAVSALIAAIFCVVASYVGFALRRIVNKFLVVPQQPPTIFRK